MNELRRGTTWALDMLQNHQNRERAAGEFQNADDMKRVQDVATHLF